MRSGLPLVAITVEIMYHPETEIIIKNYSWNLIFRWRRNTRKYAYMKAYSRPSLSSPPIASDGKGNALRVGAREFQPCQNLKSLWIKCPGDFHEIMQPMGREGKIAKNLAWSDRASLSYKGTFEAGGVLSLHAKVLKAGKAERRYLSWNTNGIFIDIVRVSLTLIGWQMTLERLLGQSPCKTCSIRGS